MSKVNTKEKQRIKIVPDKIFYDLWKGSSNYDNVEDFISAELIDREYKRFEDLGVKYDEAAFMIKAIYETSHKSIKDLMNEIGISNAYLSNAYGIPVRTIEDWCSKRNRCPDHIRISLSKDYNILNLGNYIRLQSDIDKMSTKRKVYVKHKQAPEAEDVKLNVVFSEHGYEDVIFENVSSILRKTDYLDRKIKRNG